MSVDFRNIPVKWRRPWMCSRTISARFGQAGPMRRFWTGLPWNTMEWTPPGPGGHHLLPRCPTLVIQPWDTKLLKEIQKAIQVSDLGINPQNDGRVIRLVFPSSRRSAGKT